MKEIILAFVFICSLNFALFSQITQQPAILNLPQQQYDPCGTASRHNALMQNNQTYSQKMEEFEYYVKNTYSYTPKAAAQFIVPVVVHVIHKGEALGVGTNISDEDIIAKIRQVNNEFRKIIGSL